MAVYVSALFVALLPTAAAQEAKPAPRDRAVKRALLQLQGSWQFESLEEDGKKVAGDELKQRTLFFGADIFLMRRGSELLQAGNVQVNPAKTPRSINAIVSKGENKGRVMLGIYELKGDTLRLCLDIEGEERPKDFKAAEGSKRLIAVCKRIRHKNEDVDITGPYRSEAIQDNGTKYTADVMIERLGDAYIVTYKKGPVTAYVAVGIRQGDVFCLAWANQGQVGVTVYRIEPGPRLVGQYAHLGGAGIVNPEILTRAKKTLDARRP
jgi:uncharacterized protein (TIGR03067 family)